MAFRFFIITPLKVWVLNDTATTLLSYIMFKVEVKQGHIEQTQMKRPLYQKGVTSMKATVA